MARVRLSLGAISILYIWGYESYSTRVAMRAANSKLPQAHVGSLKLRCATVLRSS